MLSHESRLSAQIQPAEAHVLKPNSSWTKPGHSLYTVEVNVSLPRTTSSVWVQLAVWVSSCCQPGCCLHPLCGRKKSLLNYCREQKEWISGPFCSLMQLQLLLKVRVLFFCTPVWQQEISGLLCTNYPSWQPARHELWAWSPSLAAVFGQAVPVLQQCLAKLSWATWVGLTCHGFGCRWAFLLFAVSFQEASMVAVVRFNPTPKVLVSSSWALG